LETTTKIPGAAEACISLFSEAKFTANLAAMATEELLFMALASVRVNPTQSIDLLNKIWERQTKDGFLPAFISDESPALPLAGLILEKIYRSVPVGAGIENNFKQYVEKALLNHRWWYKNAADEETSILKVSYDWEHTAIKRLVTAVFNDDLLVHKNEGDAPGVLFNAIIAASNESLIHLGGKLGLDISDLMYAQEMGIYCLDEKYWNDSMGTYNIGPSEYLPQPINEMILMVGGIPTQDQAEQLLARLCIFAELDQMALEYPDAIKTTPQFISLMEQPFFSWLLINGLLRYDMEDMAEVASGFFLKLFESQYSNAEEVFLSAMYINILQA
jgi:hypothetical protein